MTLKAKAILGHSINIALVLAIIVAFAYVSIGSVIALGFGIVLIVAITAHMIFSPSI